MESRSAAVVTGAGNGLGLGLARALAAREMSVVLADINEAALERAADLLRKDGADVLAVRTDVTKQASVDELAASIPRDFGQVEVVCLNAGVSMRGETWSLSLDDWRWIYDVNVFGVVHGIRSFVPALINSGRGHVVITSSNTAITTLPALPAYVSSKHAVLSIGESLQQDLLLAGSAVRVSVVL